jgi:TfoX/Sxy family transcriptional regulator of competence genes
MAFDEVFAERVRELVESLDAETREQKMFGGIAWMLRGNMLVGIIGDELMLRTSPEVGAAVLREPHTRPMDMSGRPMQGFTLIDQAACEGDSLQRWFDLALAYVDPMPPKRK